MNIQKKPTVKTGMSEDKTVKQNIPVGGKQKPLPAKKVWTCLKSRLFGWKTLARPTTLRSTCHIGAGGKSVHKPASIKQVYPHFFFWIKPANVPQVVGRLLNLPDVGRSLVSFRVCDTFSCQTAQPA